MPEILFFQTFLWAYSLCQRMGSTVINVSHPNINEEANHSPFEKCSIYLDVIYQLSDGNKWDRSRQRNISESWVYWMKKMYSPACIHHHSVIHTTSGWNAVFFSPHGLISYRSFHCLTLSHCPSYPLRTLLFFLIKLRAPWKQGLLCPNSAQ